MKTKRTCGLHQACADWPVLLVDRRERVNSAFYSMHFLHVFKPSSFEQVLLPHNWLAAAAWKSLLCLIKINGLIVKLCKTLCETVPFSVDQISNNKHPEAQVSLFCFCCDSIMEKNARPVQSHESVSQKNGCVILRKISHCDYFAVRCDHETPRILIFKQNNEPVMDCGSTSTCWLKKTRLKRTIFFSSHLWL